MTMKKLQNPVLMAVIALSAMALTFAASGAPGSGVVTADDLSRDLLRVATTAGATEVSKRLMTTDSGVRGNAPLTEGRAVAILQKAGFAATTSHPDHVLTREQADVLVQRFRSSLVAPATKFGSTTAGAGVPDSIDQCFDQKNHGLCMDCCKGLGGGASACAKACMVINKPSASEPIP
jgi:hypothetical protein